MEVMVATVEHRYGRVNRMPKPIEWLSDNGSCYTARGTRSFARDIGLVPRTTPISSPQSNGMAEAFVRTLKRDYVRVNPRPDAQTEASVSGLLKTAASLAEKGSQILIATSEQLENVQQFVADLPCQLLAFDGPIIRRLDVEATIGP